jgi:hypothetical protein
MLTFISKIRSVVCDISGGYSIHEWSDAARRRDIARVNTILLPVLILALSTIFLKSRGNYDLGAMLLWAASSLTAGGIMGFLFGIPKSGTAGTTKEQEGKTESDATMPPTTRKETNAVPRPNTNLEEISDWLTKIIVGLTLVHLKDIEQRVQAISANAAAGFVGTPSPSAISFATALITSFAIIGFLISYLYTRLFLQGAFARSDTDLRKDWDSVLREEFAKGAKDVTEDLNKGSLPTPEQVQSAERVKDVAFTEKPEIVARPMRELALEYEQIRRSMASGPDRTRALTRVVRKMGTLALAAQPFLPQLAASGSQGDRLAAIVLLKFKFDATYIDWLLKRLTDEPAFVAYQAAGALLAGVRLVGPTEKDRIKQAVSQIKAELQARGFNDTGVHAILDQILAS